LTSKLQISKHQQVQLLEAASVLVGLREQIGTEYAASSSDISGVSDINEEPSSPESTPDRDDTSHHRYSSNGSDTVFSQSYRSVSDHFTRPTTSGTDITDNTYSKSYELQSSYEPKSKFEFRPFEPNSGDTLRGPTAAQLSRNKTVDSDDEMEGIETETARVSSNAGEDLGVFGHME